MSGKPPTYTLTTKPYQKNLIKLFGIVPTKKVLNNYQKIASQVSVPTRRNTFSHNEGSAFKPKKGGKKRKTCRRRR